MSALRDILVGDPGDAPSSAPPPQQPPSHDHPSQVPATPSAAANAASPSIASAPKPSAPVEPAQTTDHEHAEEHAAATPQSRDNAYDPGNPHSVAKTGKANPAAAAAMLHGNRIKHLKKEDGIPLWRKDIQFDFLDLIFHDTTRCFTQFSDKSSGHTFAEVYVDAMANSSKCSKTLAGKLMEDLVNSLSMAMVCLLVNIGRMNTTLNFFPEMRAQLRTYHSIPALQAHQDAQAYKQLQDAPRLKSILKGASEDIPQPSTVEELRATPRPRTNPVNLIFIMAQYSPKITELHFEPPVDFFDLIMRTTLSSKSRARAFLWLLWWYMESDFTAEDSQRNPFGPGHFGEGEHGPGAVPERVPAFESLTEEQAALENVDTEVELHFGEVKRNERTAILGSEPSPAMTALKRARKEKGLLNFQSNFASDDERSEAGYYGARPPGRSSRLQETGSEYTRSPSPAGARTGQHDGASSSRPGGDLRIMDVINMDEHLAQASRPAVPKKGPGRGNWRRNKAPKVDASSHVPLLPNNSQQLNFVNEGPSTPGSFPNKHGSPSHSNTITFTNAKGEHVPTPSYQQQKRTRGITQHQSAVINHRRRQIEYTLDRRIRRIHARAEEQRDDEGSIIRAWKRIRQMPVDYDSEEETARANSALDEDSRRGQRLKDNDFGDDLDGGPGRHNVFLTPLGISQPDTVGEEARHLCRAFWRASRRLDRWDESLEPAKTMIRRMMLAEAGAPLQPTKKRHTYPPDDGNDGLEEEIKERRSSVYRGRGRGRGGRGGAGGRASKLAKQVDDDMGDMDDEEREMLDAGDDDDEMDED